MADRGLRYTVEDLQALGFQVDGERATRRPVEASQGHAVPAGLLAPDRPPTAILEAQRPAYRSKVETRYAEVLRHLQREGEIRWWAYEPIRLHLAARTTLTPDFLVQWHLAPWPLVFIETKGTWVREDSWVKLKVAARLYAGLFRFRLATWDRQTWRCEEVTP